MSRWTTRLRCAAETAAQTSRNRSRRSSTGRPAQYSSIGTPSTYSIASQGTLSSSTPPSTSRAIPGWSSRARIWRSCRKRWINAVEAAARRTRLITTSWSNCSSSRRARYTTPMPPEPIRSSTRNGPSFCPIRRSSPAFATRSAALSAAEPRSPTPDSAAATRSSTRRRRSGSSQFASSHARRSSAGRSSTPSMSSRILWRSSLTADPCRSQNHHRDPSEDGEGGNH